MICNNWRQIAFVLVAAALFVLLIGGSGGGAMLARPNDLTDHLVALSLLAMQHLLAPVSLVTVMRIRPHLASD